MQADYGDGTNTAPRLPEAWRRLLNVAYTSAGEIRNLCRCPEASLRNRIGQPEISVRILHVDIVVRAIRNSKPVKRAFVVNERKRKATAMETIDRDRVREMVEHERELVLIDVMPPQSYREFHLPRAINVPADDNFDRQVQREVPNKQRPVIVYCQDEQSAASRRAAARLTELGYENVYDYAAGKMDWRKAGLAVE